MTSLKISDTDLYKLAMGVMSMITPSMSLQVCRAIAPLVPSSIRKCLTGLLLLGGSEERGRFLWEVNGAEKEEGRRRAEGH